MTEKRFTTDNGSHEDVCLVDNLTKKEYESNFEDMVSLMNDIWNQTQRFEKHNQRLEKENEKLKSVNQELRNELKFDEEMYKTFKEIIDEADDLITSHLSKHYQRQWKNFCTHRGVLDD